SRLQFGEILLRLHHGTFTELCWSAVASIAVACSLSLLTMWGARSSYDDIAAIPDDFRVPNHTFDAWQLKRARRPASSEVIEFLDITEIQAGAFFQVGNSDLGRRYVESFLESRQILDIFLPKHESGG